MASSFGHVHALKSLAGISRTLKAILMFVIPKQRPGFGTGPLLKHLDFAVPIYR